ncbi:MAG: undecaprenyl/decaprenyl-phosphate alpha-N-acetylglucosaminyl 1-phosphate transferase [Thermoflexales bacterium]|nr:undecaprenyl/decaprenyl-phosphate alpha-N-acetylglucosaminyl 1-phosphate transferase [Thermoflexales bacterium]
MSISPIIVCISALGVALVGTPLARQIAPRLGIIDHPSARKLHVRPVPLMGGAAIYVGVVLALLLIDNPFRSSELAGIVIGASVLALTGLWDDRAPLSAGIKLLIQIGTTVILIISGVQVQLPVPYALNIAITLAWVVGITNAINLLDNMDGLSGGICAIAAAFFTLLAALNDQILVGALAAAVMGACLGFLVYNFNPASIFMGDAGTLFLGFVLAGLGIKLRFPGASSPWMTWMVPVLVLGVPIFDTTLVFISRLRRGVNPLTTAGKDHTSHRLARFGLSHREAVMALYLVACGCGLAAVYVAKANAFDSYFLTGMMALLGAWGLWRLEFKSDPKGLA